MEPPYNRGRDGDGFTLSVMGDFEMRWTAPRKQKALESYHRTGVIPDGFTPEEIRDLDCRYSVFGLQGLKQTKLQRKM